ncbi:MAG: D-alanyl-D-alanine carboxypeptidase/D-alanyl-D-alanine-endopeptidase [Betaproteobacteria bacterium]|nr:MAG: D-alanyl-D-alanine carboxypeptidase/D-alanyl-D-alanine-endopeptidase [Betaproteobacteria bacterium]
MNFPFSTQTSIDRNMAVKAAIFTFALAITASQSALAAMPKPLSQSFRAAGVPESSVAIYVREVGRERPIIEHRAAVPMNPASTMKLVTTLVGLDALSPSYSWKTEFLTDGRLSDGVLDGALYIRGGGDPKFTWENLQVAIKALREQGIREIKGDFVMDRSRFIKVADDPAQFDGKPLRPYNVMPDALLYNFKSVGFKFSPQPDNSVSITSDGPIPDGLDIVNRLRATGGSCGDWRTLVTPVFESSGNAVRASFTGTYAKECGDRDWYVSLFDHAGIVSGSFAKLWRDSGGVWSGRARDGIVPAIAQKRFTHSSPPLSSMISDINKFSNNVMARQLLLTIDSELRKSAGSVASATQSVRDWAGNRGFDVPDLRIENGSGLSRTERISAKSMGRFLEYGLTAPYSRDFVLSLPVAATDGTLSRRFNNMAADGNAFLKTGTLDGVKTLAGYLMLPDKRLVLFVGFINHPNADAGVKALDAAVEWVYQNPPSSKPSQIKR